MDDLEQPTADVTEADQFGQGFAAGCRLLRSRYHLSEEAAFLVAVAVVATAIGPAARVRDPLGGDLPSSLNIIFCATSQGPISAALSDAFRVFREMVGQKAVWRENVGSRRLRTDFLAALTALEAVEEQIRHAAPPPTPPASAPFPTPDEDAVLRRTKLERENWLAHRDILRAELREHRMNLAPFLVAENPGWDTVLALDQLAFDHCMTSISSDGAALRELLVSTPKQVGKIARLLQASHRGYALTDGAKVLLNPVLISMQVVTPELLAAAFRNRTIREAGFLQGAILEVAENSVAFEAAAFVDATDENRWLEFVSGLFARRVRDCPQLYMLDERGFNILEDFRQWCLRTGTEHPALAGLVVDWPSLALKFALCVHLAAGKEEQETLELVTVGTVTELMKSVGSKQLSLLERLGQTPIQGGSHTDEVGVMVGKLAGLGGVATMRDLFRCYDEQDYALHTPILERAAAAGYIQREGKRLRLAPTGSKEAETSVSVRQS